MLEVWNRAQASSRARAAERLADGYREPEPLSGLNLRLPEDFVGLNTRKSGGGPAPKARVSRSSERRPYWEPLDNLDSNPDTSLLSTVDDERVVLADLDSDLQLTSLGGRSPRRRR